MNEVEMIEYIYSVVSNKTIQFGTIIEDKEGKKLLQISGAYALDVEGGCKIAHTDYVSAIKGYKVIGNPVNIGDILHWIDINMNGPKWSDYIISVCDIWAHKHIGIEGQTDRCIAFIYKLVQGNLKNS